MGLRAVRRDDENKNVASNIIEKKSKISITKLYDNQKKSFNINNNRNRYFEMSN